MPSGFLFMLAWVSSAQGAYAEQQDRWISIPGSEQYDVFLDTHTTQRRGGRVVVWMKMLHRAPERNPFGDQVDETRSQREYDCAARTENLLAYAQLYRGRTVRSHSLRSHELRAEPVIPETIGEAILNQVCA